VNEVKAARIGGGGAGLAGETHRDRVLRDPGQAYRMEVAVECRDRVLPGVADDVAQHNLDPSGSGLGYSQREPPGAGGQRDNFSVRCARPSVGRDEAHVFIGTTAEAKDLRASLHRARQRQLFFALQPKRRLTRDRRKAGRRLDQGNIDSRRQVHRRRVQYYRRSRRLLVAEHRARGSAQGQQRGQREQVRMRSMHGKRLV